ncbi:MAG: hypothetical protein ACRDOO_10185 [Actinomadura sp.]
MMIRHVAVVVGAALTAAACTGGSGRPAGSPSPDRSNPGAVIDEAPTLRPLALDRTPLWSHRTKGAPKTVGGAALRGDSAILVGGSEKGRNDRLVVVDAATGKVRWSIEEYEPLRNGGGADWRTGFCPPGSAPPTRPGWPCRPERTAASAGSFRSYRPGPAGPPGR